MQRDPFTAALHADDALAELPDVAPPIRPTTTFEHRAGGRVYRRISDETTERLETVLGALEGGHSVAYPSGMAAVAAVLRQVRPRRIALPTDVYHGVRGFVAGEANHGSWDVVDRTRLEPGDVWWVETPSNPKCLITDLAAVAGEAADRGIVTVADATFATPILQDTLGLGVDFSVHATTKFIAGHSDAMGGVVSTRNEAQAIQMRETRVFEGAIPGTLETWLTLRGIRTLPLRIARQSETALELATYLHDRGLHVWYPGLPTHPGHEIAAQQMDAFGGVLSFELADSAKAAMVVDTLRLFTSATSLGGVEHRVRSDPHSPPGLIRLSIGLESAGALQADLASALDRAGQ